MRTLVQISRPAALVPVATTDIANAGTSLRWKRHGFCHRMRTQLPLPGSRIIRCRERPVEQEQVAALPSTIFPEKGNHGAIGITSFLKGKNYLVSGATGFLAKAFVEKLLRTVPDVGKIFLLIRAKNKDEAKQRLYTDIINSDLFKPLKQTYGDSYEAFMESKLVPVIGNIAEDNLGMDDDTFDEIASQIDVIVNSAASTTLDERYDVALNINTRGPDRLLSFAKKCKNLCLFLQFSTAYANGKREGNIAEEPLYMGQSIATKRIVSRDSPVSNPALDVKGEMELALRSLQTYKPDEITSRMKELGQERANVYGWKNGYTLTKAMGEMLINNNRENLPVVIVRPSIIESAYREPYPGWIQGNKVLDPIISMYGKGQVPGFVFDPQVVIDVIPVDMVVNTAIAAMAKHGQTRRPELNVYHTTSSSVNPLTLGQMFDICYNYFTSSPMRNSNGEEIKIKKMEAMSSVNDFSAYMSNIIANQETVSNGNLHSKLEMKWKRKIERIVKVARLYQPYFFYHGWFENENSQQLIDEMSSEEREMFDFDIRSLNWKDYFADVHIPGIKKHVMKGRC